MADIAAIEIQVKAEKLRQLKEDLGETANEYSKMVSTITTENKRMEKALEASAKVQEEAMSRVTGAQAQRETDAWFTQQRRRLAMMAESERIAERQAREAERVAAAARKAEGEVVAAHRRRLAMAREREAAMERQLMQEMRVAEAMERSNAVAQRNGHAFSTYGQIVQQTGYQFGDFIVQVQSGTNAWVAAGQQATQMAGLLLLASNPVVLTMGAILSIVIPLATAYGAYASRTQEAADKTNTFKNSLRDLQTATEDIKRSIDASRLGVEEAEVDAVLKINAAKKEQLRIEQEIRSGVGPDRLKELNQQLSIQRNIVMEQEDGLRWYRVARDELARIRKEEEDRARKQEESQRLVDSLVQSQLAGIRGLTSALGAAESQAATFVGVADNLAGALGRAAAAWGVILGGPITGAPGALGRYEASGSADAAARNNAMTMGKLGGRLATGAGGVRNFASGGGGGGGGGTNPIEQQLETLRSFLQSEAEVELEAYRQRQDTLRAALEQRMITLEEFNSLEKELKIKHNEEMAQIDAYRYGNGLAVTTQWFSDMANAMQSGGEKMARVGRVFNAAIALQNSYVAFTEVLKDPAFIGRPFARAAAASAILAQGLSAVAAIRGSGSSTGGGRGSVGRVQTQSAPAPQTVYVSGLAPDALFTGGMISNLFENFYQENDNRGKVFVVAR